MPSAPAAIAELFSAELSFLRTTWSGRQLQQHCWLSPLLSLGVPAVLGRKKGPGDPKHNLERLLEAGPRDTRLVESGLQQGLERGHVCIHSLLRKALTAGDAPREAVTAWLSWALQRNSLRASVITPEARKAGNQEYMTRYKQLAAATAGDEFVCNLAAAALRLCEPFLKFGEVPPAGTLLKLRPAHYRRGNRADRVDYSDHTRLAGAIVSKGTGRGTAAGSSSGGLFDVPDEPDEADEADETDGPDAAGAGGAVAEAAAGEEAAAWSFVAEAFFLAQYAMHVALVPTSHHMAFQMGVHKLQVQQMGGHVEHHTLYCMQASYAAHLLVPATLQLSLDLMRLQVAWLTQLAALPPPHAQRAFEAVPAFVLYDMADWLTWVARMKPEELALQPLRPLVEGVALLLRKGCTTLCEGPRLIRSPVVLAKLVHLLHDLVVPASAGGRDDGMLGAGGWAGDVGGRLSQAVLGHASVRQALVLPLAAVYAEVDSVEGLDVDAVEAAGFEKFSIRAQINTLLLHLWRLPDGRAPMLRLAEATAAGAAGAAKEGELLPRFAGCMLDTLLYELEEGLRRVREVNQGMWGAGGDNKAELEHHMGYARHLFTTSLSTLELLQALVQEPPLAALFATGRLAVRTATLQLALTLSPSPTLTLTLTLTPTLTPTLTLTLTLTLTRCARRRCSSASSRASAARSRCSSSSSPSSTSPTPTSASSRASCCTASSRCCSSAPSTRPCATPSPRTTTSTWACCARPRPSWSARTRCRPSSSPPSPRSSPPCRPRPPRSPTPPRARARARPPPPPPPPPPPTPLLPPPPPPPAARRAAAAAARRRGGSARWPARCAGRT